MTDHQIKSQRAARLMVERFGEMALPQVDLRIRELQLRGEDEAVSLWQGIRASSKPFRLIARTSRNTRTQFGPTELTLPNVDQHGKINSSLRHDLASKSTSDGIKGMPDMSPAISSSLVRQYLSVANSDSSANFPFRIVSISISTRSISSSISRTVVSNKIASLSIIL